MPKFIMCKGLPASGKSTWAIDYIAKSKEPTIRVNNDTISLMLIGKPFGNTNLELLEKIRESTIDSAMKLGLGVIVDCTNLKPQNAERYKLKVDNFNAAGLTTEAPVRYEFSIKDFTDVPVEVCIQRNACRQYPVPVKVIQSMYRAHLAPENRVIEQDASLPKAIICDIDGTIAALGSRSPRDTTRVSEDLPVAPVIDLVKTYHSLGHKIIFITGRQDSCRQDTEKWLIKHTSLSPTTFTLYMRATGDNTPDYIFKKDIFEKYIRDKFYIDFVLEDRERMVKMFRETIGLPCFQVANTV